MNLCEGVSRLYMQADG